jgi:transcriptional regulator with XRE-family HTH domain
MSHILSCMQTPDRHRQNGAAIRAIREALRLTVTELAEYTGSHPQTLRNIELDRRPASDELLTLIARALQVDIAAILRNPPPTAIGTARRKRRPSFLLPEEDRQPA